MVVYDHWAEGRYVFKKTDSLVNVTWWQDGLEGDTNSWGMNKMQDKYAYKGEAMFETYVNAPDHVKNVIRGGVDFDGGPGGTGYAEEPVHVPGGGVDLGGFDMMPILLVGGLALAFVGARKWFK